jgi:hypothetical protein
MQAADAGAVATPQVQVHEFVLPPGDGKYLVIGHSAENVSPASSSPSR